MGKATGFLEYERVENPGQEPLERIKTYREFHTPLNPEERQKQGARCMRCSILSEWKANHGHGVRLSAEQPLSGVERTGL